MIAALDKYHGLPTGIFSGDECLAGTSAVQGTELCALVEYMYSLELLTSLWGDPAFADRLERIAFNALPATFTEDMWAHQYDQQTNQIECSVRENRTWNTNKADANIFGLEPTYGCCTSNLSQGWPKFAGSLWMCTPTDGIAAVAYAPSSLRTEIRGTTVHIELDTDYPFRQDLSFTVDVSRPVRFPLYLRIPGWAKGATIELGEQSQPVQHGQFHIIEQEWEGQTHLKLHLPMPTQIIQRPGNAVSIARGPIIYALKIGEEWRQINKDKPYRELPHGDWEVYPTTPWNFALDLSNTEHFENIMFTEYPLQERAFSTSNPPITATCRGRRLSAWTEKNGSACPTPAGPVHTDSPAEDLLLIPYGCTKLRIAEFPVVLE